LSGTCHDFSFRFTSSSRLTLPLYTSANAAIAVNGLLIEAA